MHYACRPSSVFADGDAVIMSGPFFLGYCAHVPDAGCLAEVAGPWGRAACVLLSND